MYGETPFVFYTVCINHVVEKVASSTALSRFPRYVTILDSDLLARFPVMQYRAPTDKKLK